MFWVSKYVEYYLGKFYLELAPPMLDKLIQESDYKTPIIFVLSQGADPTLSLM